MYELHMQIMVAA